MNGSWWLWFLVLCTYSLPIAYLTEILLGLPAWIIFRRCGIRSFAAFAAGGVLIGWVVDLVLAVVGGRPAATALNPWSPGWMRFDFYLVASASACTILFRAILFSTSLMRRIPFLR